MSKKSILFVLIFLLSAFATYAGIPQKINYQGYLTDAAGTPITTTTPLEMTFSIYSSETTTSFLWRATYSVDITEGRFNILLGDPDYLGANKEIPYTVFNGSIRYLGIKVGTDAEMTPRKKLVSVGNSYRAYNADQLDGKAASAFLQKIDNVTPNSSGNVDLVAAGTVTITPDNNNHRITISASGVGDNLGNHTAMQNVKLNNHWLSGDGGNEGVYVKSDGKVGIGKSSPAQKLDVNGTAQMIGFKMTTGAGSGKVLTSNSSGTGTWQTFSGGDNLGNHTATQNIKLNGHYLSGDGGNEGIYINNDGVVYAKKGLVCEQGWVQAQGGIIAGSPSGSVIGRGITSESSIRSENDILAKDDVKADDKVIANGGIEGYISSSSTAVYAKNNGSGRAIHGVANTGYASIDGWNTGSGAGVWGGNSSGSYGYLGAGQYGVYGSGGRAVYGSTSTGNAIRGYASSGSGYAGYFSGKVHINGVLSKSAGSFKIDHPLDPANKYLCHSFVESPDMMNIYNGNVTLDSNGEASIQLPEWFEALNKDFRYQLTCIGGFAQVFVAQEIKNNQFKIAGGNPGMKVSWQVTGIRHDAYANAHRIPVEEEKELENKGKFMHPAEHGAPESLAIDYEDRKNAEQEASKQHQELEKSQR